MSFIKRKLALLLIAALLLVLCPSALAAGPSLHNFTRNRTYQDGQFSDVAADAWYSDGVRTAYELGLMTGTSDTTFRPEGDITIVETLVMAARLHKIYYTGEADFPQTGGPWYSPYLSYGRENQLHTLFDDDPYLFETADRLTFGAILAEALPADALPAINRVDRIPDLTREESWSAADEIYLLYNAGILTGSDAYGTFHPFLPIDRAAVATIVARLALPEARIQFSLQQEDGTAPHLLAYFLDVGQGDAIYLECDGSTMLIDGGSPSQSSKIYSFLQNLGIGRLDYIVSTHPHNDHAGGLAGALNALPVGAALSPTLDTTLATGTGFENFLKYLSAQGVPVTIPTAGDTFSLGRATVDVLGPIPSGVTNTNNLSLVLKVTLGNTSFLFTGDAEEDEEAAILASGADLGCDVLKLGHHGSDSSTSSSFLSAARPRYAVLSVGANNQYGHPTEAVLGRLREAGITTYRTDLQGDILAVSDGDQILFAPARNQDADTLSAPGSTPPVKQADPPPSGAQGPIGNPDTADYVANLNTHVFHRPGCSSVGRMSEKNKWFYVGTREELLELGYTSCGICGP